MSLSHFLSHRSCPVCGSCHAAILHSIDYASDVNVLPKHYDIVSCKDCSTVFNDFSDDAEVFNVYYRDCGKYADKTQCGGGGDSAEEREKWQYCFSRLQSFIRQDSAILEVGCGKGGFLRLLKEHGFNNLCAVEPSSQCLEQLKKDGIDAFPDISGLTGEKFDLIILHAVLEHLVFPRKMLSSIVELLNPGGAVMLSVPDAASYYEYPDSPFYYFDREHINHFTADSLTLLCSLHGLSPLDLETIRTPAVGPMGYYRDILGIFQLKKNEPLKKILEYVESCKTRSLTLPEEAKLAPNVFLWGIGAFAENLLSTGFFAPCRNLHLLDANKGKQSENIAGLPIHPPEFLFQFPPEECVVIISSVLYKTKIIEALKQMKFKGKYFALC